MVMAGWDLCIKGDDMRDVLTKGERWRRAEGDGGMGG